MKNCNDWKLGAVLAAMMETYGADVVLGSLAEAAIAKGIQIDGLGGSSNFGEQ